MEKKGKTAPAPARSDARRGAASRGAPAPVEKGRWLPVLSLLALVMAGYANTLHNSGFALDNKFTILEDPRLRAPTGENLRLIFTHDYWWPKIASGLYRPLTTLSYLANYALLGNRDRAAGYHWVNLGLHALAVLLVYLLARRLIKDAWLAFFAAAIFAVHPIATESVTNIVGRADLLAAISVLGGLLCYLKSQEAEGRRRIAYLAALSVVSLAGVLSKESAVTVLGVMLLYDLIYRLERRDVHRLASLGKNLWLFLRRGYVALAPPLLILWIVRARVFLHALPPSLPWVDNPIIGAGFLSARLTAVKVAGRYLGLLLFPRRLSCDYSYNQIPVVNLPFRTGEDWSVLLVLGLFIGILGLAVRNLRRERALFFFAFLALVAFLPTSNLVPRPGEPILQKESWAIGSIMAERFMYLPLAGFAGCLVLALSSLGRRLPGRFRPQFIVCLVLGLLVLLYAGRTAARNRDWEDDLALWTSAVRACPNSFKTHKSLAYAIYEQDPQGRQVDRCIEEAEKARAITDRSSIVFLHLGTYYRVKGDLSAGQAADGSLVPSAEGRPWYEKSIHSLKKAEDLDLALSESYRRRQLQIGRAQDQVADIGNREIYSNLGLSCMRLGEADSALTAYAGMRRVAPNDPNGCLGRASAFYAKHDLDQTAIALLEAFLLDPTNPETSRLLGALYRSIDPTGSAFLGDSGAPALNFDSPVVHGHLCVAQSELIRDFVQAHERDRAEQIARSAVETYHCPEDRLRELIRN